MRIYNGQPDSELSAKIRNRQEMIDEMKFLAPDAHLVYYPVEEKYMVWLDLEPISEMHFQAENALHEAIQYLENKENN